MNSTTSDETYAALITPRFDDGSIDPAATQAVASFVASRGIVSFAVNGATGEFCLTSPEELAIIVRSVRNAHLAISGLLCGVGSASISTAKQLAQIAESEGATGLLVPAPIFFRYSQDDLKAFVEDLASHTSLPVVIYNLPQFSSGFSKETVASLIRDVPNVIGVKDSSGSLEIVRHLTDEGIEGKRFIGNDAVFVAALRENLCDGVVSGVACAIPELMRQLVDSFNEGDGEAMHRYDKALAECVQQLDSLPAPWGIKWLVEARNVARACFAQPVAAVRLQEAQALTEWFPLWFEENHLAREKSSEAFVSTHPQRRY